MKKELLSELGLPKNSRVLLLNHDDLGMNYGSNIAFLEISNNNSVQSGSVMVPCPWFPHISEVCKKNNELNIGVHLTLTSEWSHYRWRPLSTSNKSSGLIDSDGYFWKSRKLLRQNINKDAAEIELRAQIDRALNSGIDITHLDCHMGVGIIPELVEIYIKLGNDYKLPVLIPKNISETLKLYKIDDADESFYVNIINNLEDNGYPLVDNFKITPCFPSSEAKSGYEGLLSSTPQGITFLSLHPNTSDSIKSIDSVMYHVRIDEYQLFRRYFNIDWLKARGIEAINYRQIRDILRKNLSS